MWWLAWLALYGCVAALVVLFAVRRWAASRRPLVPSIAFFHPFCNAGGGGERVLWCAIRALQQSHPHYAIVVYTGDVEASTDDILRRADERFGVRLEHAVHFVYLRWRGLIEAHNYPVFTLLGQAIGGALLAAEALYRHSPHVFVDSMGVPFALPLFRLAGACRVACYVHYPVVSGDMLRRVAERRPAHNNASAVARSRPLSLLKLVYYRLFASLYGWAGASAHCVMVNSTWTYGHIVDIWRRPERTRIVYPPCDVDTFRQIQVASEQLFVVGKEIRVLSVGQFRPEKDHALQLEVFGQLRAECQRRGVRQQLRLVLAGSCRHDDDLARVESLKVAAKQLGVADSVVWRLNLSFEDLQIEMGRALVGIHTMWNEHFGIGVVEQMAAGNLVVAHNSGGPKLDILQAWEDEPVGFVATTAEEYVTAIADVIEMSVEQRDAVRTAARAAVARFSDSVFDQSFTEAISVVL